MRTARFFPAVLAVVSVVGFSACGPEPEPPSIARCEIDLAPYAGSGSGAKARVATKDDLLEGEAATGRPGDVLLENDRVRILIEAAGRTLAPQPYGGNLIDAGLVNGSGKSFDAFGELGALFQFGRTVNHELVEVVRDGSDGGAAVVAATGRDSTNDFINLPGMIANYISGLDMPDVNSELGLRVTTWYVLPPGSNSVKIVQAFCNDGNADVEPLAVGDLVDSGGVVGYFTAVGNGFSGGGSIGDLTGALNSKLPSETFVAWVNDEVAYGYMPEGDFASLVVAGVTSTLHGKAGLTDWLGTLDEAPDGAVTVPKGGKTLVSREFVVTRDVAGLYDHYYKARKIETGTVKGTVKNLDGKPMEGVRVAALRGEGKNETLLSLFTTDSKGAFSGLVPAGDVRLVADSRIVRSGPVNVSVAKGKETSADLELPDHATLVVKIRDGDGNAIPGKITVGCDGPCAHPRSDNTAAYFHDVKTDSLPPNTFEIVYVGTEGEASIDVAPGSYRVSVSRGIEWSLDTQDVTVVGGDTANLTGTIEHVVDTTGWVSADFHVHAINSPDSPVPNVERLKTFLAEGVDVIVATDHDFITDLNPFLDLIPDGRKHLKAVTGAEITTFDYGHYNAFPLVADPTSRNGGAIDWAGGQGKGMTPGDIFAAAHAFPGEQVVQLNHARSGFFGALRMDTRTLWTREPTTVHRIRDVEPEDPNSGDTGLFDDGFTALEIMNGTSRADFDTLINDWFSLLSRGFTRTATAVSDTHKRHGDSGHPRSFIRLGVDAPADVDDQDLAVAVNAGKVMGTNGPFVLATARAGSGEPVGLGGTLKSNGGTVTVDVEVRTPHWMSVSTAKVFVNTPNTESDGSSASGNTKFPTAQAQAALEEEAAAGLSRTFTASVDLELERDAWIVVVVEGEGDLFPVVGKGSTPPLAFTNAIYVDVDGNGWTPPVDLAAERARIGKITPRSMPLSRPPTELELRELLRGCHHEHSHFH